MNQKYLAQLSAMLQPYRTMTPNVFISTCAFATDLAVYYLLDTIPGTNILISNLLAIGSGLIVGAALHTQYDRSRVKEKTTSLFLRLSTVAFGGYWLSTYLILGLMNFFDSSSLLAKFISIPVFFMFQHAIITKLTPQITYEKRVSTAYPTPAPNPPPLVPLRQALRIRHPEDHTRP